MSSLATVIGYVPMALARVIMGGLTWSAALTIFMVPLAYYRFFRKTLEGA